jgi:hypothetical protein
VAINAVTIDKGAMNAASNEMFTTNDRMNEKSNDKMCTPSGSLQRKCLTH